MLFEDRFEPFADQNGLRNSCVGRDFLQGCESGFFEIDRGLYQVPFRGRHGQE